MQRQIIGVQSIADPGQRSGLLCLHLSKPLLDKTAGSFAFTLFQQALQIGGEHLWRDLLAQFSECFYLLQQLFGGEQVGAQPLLLFPRQGVVRPQLQMMLQIVEGALFIPHPFIQPGQIPGHPGMGRVQVQQQCLRFRVTTQLGKGLAAPQAGPPVGEQPVALGKVGQCLRIASAQVLHPAGQIVDAGGAGVEAQQLFRERLRLPFLVAEQQVLQLQAPAFKGKGILCLESLQQLARLFQIPAAERLAKIPLQYGSEFFLNGHCRDVSGLQAGFAKYAKVCNMADRNTTIRDLLEVRPHPTVVRLADLEAESAQWLSDSFLITPEIRTHLCALQQLLERDEGGGAFLIGHYGSGKSHFLAYLIQQLGAGKLVSRPLRVVSLSLVNFAAANRLEEIVTAALGWKVEGGDRRQLWEQLDRQGEGTLLVLDELSEFLRSKEDARAFNEDVRFLQFLGEWSRDRRFWILAAMQEGIEHTGELEHSLYRKIKDRYPLRLLLTPAHVHSLIADAILLKKAGYAAAVRGLCRDLQQSQPALSKDLARLEAIYPLHPVTLALLEEIRDRFSQTRGVVDFVVTTLRGDASRGVKPFLDQPWGR